MCIDAIRSREVNYEDSSDAGRLVEKGSPQPKTVDFESPVFSSVHLPTGLFAATSSSRPTSATVATDLADLRSRIDTIAADLKAPELAGALKADTKVYEAYVFFNACFLPLAKAAFVDQGPAKIVGGAVACLALWKGVPWRSMR